jgi:hypothetical protein
VIVTTGPIRALALYTHIHYSASAQEDRLSLLFGNLTSASNSGRQRHAGSFHIYGRLYSRTRGKDLTVCAKQKILARGERLRKVKSANALFFSTEAAPYFPIEFSRDISAMTKRAVFPQKTICDVKKKLRLGNRGCATHRPNPNPEFG